MKIAGRISSVFSIAKTHGAVLQVAAGNYANAALAFICNIIIGRHLGPEGYGLFAIFQSIMRVVQEFSGHGLDSALVRFSTPGAEFSEECPEKVYQNVLTLKLLINLMIILAGFVLLKPVFVSVFSANRVETVLGYALFYGFGISLWKYILAVFQSMEKYSGYVMTTLANNSINIGLILLLLAFSQVSLEDVMRINIFASILAFFLGLFLLRDKNPLRGYRLVLDKALVKKIGRFSIWLVISTLIFILVEPLNVLMVEYFSGPSQVGLFAAGLLLARTLDHLVLSVKTVLLPKASVLVADGYKSFLKSACLLSLPLAVLVLPLFFFSSYIIELLLSEKFIHAVPIFNVLFWGYWISLVLDPFWLLFYADQKTHLLVRADLFMLAVVFILNWYTIPIMGALGAAYSFVIARLAGRILLGVFLYMILKEPRTRIDFPAQIK